MIKTKASSPQVLPEVDVTPEMALEWLDKNANNRSLSKKHVAMLADMMSAGTYKFVGDPIRFDTNGYLLDGQHRLNAIVESETTQRMVVVLGLEPESQMYMDAGRRRSPGDQLTVALGIRNAPAAAAVVRTFLQWRDRVFISETRKVSIPEVVEWATEHEELLVEAVTRGKRISNARVPTSVAVSGAVYIAAQKVNQAQANDFWDRLADGIGLAAGSPILTLRNGIIRRHNRERWTRVEEWAYYTRCWNTWRKKGTLEKLQGWRHNITEENLRLR